MFGCIIENTVNAYRHIMNVDSEDFEYFGYCQTLAIDLYVYASTLSDSTIQQSNTMNLIDLDVNILLLIRVWLLTVVNECG